MKKNSSGVNQFDSNLKSNALKAQEEREAFLKDKKGQQVRHVDVRSFSGNNGKSHRKLTTINLEEPIRYGMGDDIERWLNELCCLDASEHIDGSKSKI